MDDIQKLHVDLVDLWNKQENILTADERLRCFLGTTVDIVRHISPTLEDFEKNFSVISDNINIQFEHQKKSFIQPFIEEAIVESVETESVETV